MFNHPGLPMLLRRAVTWKAVGLTAAAAAIAAKSRFPRPGGSRHRQGGAEQAAPPRQEGTKRRNKLQTESSCGRTHLPARDTGRANKHAYGPGEMDENENVAAPAGVWNISTLSSLQGWQKYVHRHGESGESTGACKREPAEDSCKETPPAGTGGGQDGSPPDQPGKDGPAGQKPREPESVPLNMAPACCGCVKNGIRALQHEHPINQATFKTKPVDQDGTVMLGLCLAPWASGSILGLDGRVCGHIACPACTVVHDPSGQVMCKCCADRARARGTQFHGAGRLPPAIPRRAQPASRAHTRRPDRDGGTAPPRSRTPPREESRERRSGTTPDRRAPSRPPPTRREEEEENRNRRRTESPRGERRDSGERRRRAEPDERRPSPPAKPAGRRSVSLSEDYVDEDEEEESAEEDTAVRPGSNRKDRTAEEARRPEPRPPRERREREEEEEEKWPNQCRTPGCDRRKRSLMPTCCDQCSHSKGKQHNRYCQGYEDPPPDHDEWDWPDDPHDRGGGKAKGGGGKKGKKSGSHKTPAKAARDRDRKRGWGNWNKGARWKTFPMEEYNRLLKTGVAKSTLRSRMARLKTWDRAMAELEAQEAIKPLDDPSFLTPERAGAGVALLRARGYRSAELYLSTALTRHKKLFPLSIQLDLAAKDATRIAKRGRGPAKGKAPIPIPHLGQWDFRPLMTGIWFLLRISELKALNVADVKVRWGPRQRWQLALEVASSKTDQQGQGATVARDCVCPSERQSE